MNLLIWIALLPSFIIGFFIDKADKKEKEPRGELLKAFSIGILAIIFTFIITYLLGIHKMKIHANDFTQIAFYAFICVSFVEEFCKWICSYFFLHKNKNYNYLFDGIVYTVFISLGFATVENVLYAFSTGLLTAILRSITTVPAHAFFAVFSGYYMSLSKKTQLEANKRISKKYFILSLVIPILLHGFYDFCLLTQNYWFYLIYLVFVVSLYGISIYHIRKMMKMEETF